MNKFNKFWILKFLTHKLITFYEPAGNHMFDIVYHWFLKNYENIFKNEYLVLWVNVAGAQFLYSQFIIDEIRGTEVT